jgi:hypothetical protein
VTAVNSVTIAPLATMNTSDEDKATIIPFFDTFKFVILQHSISSAKASVKGFSARMPNRIRFVPWA